MALTDDQKARVAQFGQRLDRPEQEQDDQWRSEGALGDTAVGLAAGAMELPGMATGLADIPAGLAGFDRPFSRAADAVGEATGFQPSEWADTLREERYSPQMQEARSAVAQEWEDVGEADSAMGAIREGAGAVGSYFTNPRAIQGLVTESLPATLAGGFLGRGLAAASGTRTAAPTIGALSPAGRTTALESGTMFAGRSGPAMTGAAASARGAGQAVATGQAARQAGQAAGTLRQTSRLSPVAAGAIGEGAVVAGMSMNEIDEDVDPQRAALTALGLGAGSALIARGGAEAARRAGVVDPETALAGGGWRADIDAPRRGIISRVAGGAAAEGAFQEMPQEALQQLGTNWAEGEPLFQGVPRAAVEGLLAGGVMGGAVNILPPRRAQRPTDLTQTLSASETRDQDAPSGPMETSGRDVNTLLRYHRRLSRVANEATDHPDLQDEAIRRLEGVMQELDNQGIPREVVDQELAKSRYTEAQLELEQMQKQYRNALRTDPAKARRYLDKARQRATEIQQLESAYGEEALQSPDLATIQTLQEMEGTENYFRTRQGERTNRLKTKPQQKLLEFRNLDDESLARQIAVDEEKISEGFDVDPWVPLRAAAANERGMTREFIEQVRDSDSGQGPQTSQAAQVTNVEDITTRQEFEDAAAPFDDGTVEEQEVAEEQEAPEEQDAGRVAAMQYLQEGLTPRQREVWTSLNDAVQSAQEGESSSSLINRAAENLGVTRQALERTFRRIITGTGQAAGNPEIRTMSPQRFMDFLLADTAVSEQSVPEDVRDPSQLSDDEVGEQRGDAVAELLGTDNAVTIGSPGGSQTNIGTDFDNNATRIAELIDQRRGNRSPQRVAEIDAEITRLREQNEAFQAQVQDVDAQLAAQPEPEADFEQDVADTIERRRQRQAQETAAEQQEREQAQAAAEAMINSGVGQQLGRAWDKRAQRLMDDDNRVLWDDLVDNDLPTAVEWIQTVQRIMRSVPEGQPEVLRARVRSAFEAFTGVGNETQGGRQQAQQRAGAVSEPEAEGDGAGDVAGTQEAAGDTGQETGQSGRVEEEIQQAADQTNTTPTEAQAEAGNYRKGRVRVHGFDLVIENPQGSVRQGTAPDGTEWRSTMAHHYGDIEGTVAADGDKLDVFLGENPLSDTAFIVDQVNEDGSFDEHKVMLGFDSLEQAREGYLDNYEEGWQGLGEISELSVEELRTWINEGNTRQSYALGEQASGPVEPSTRATSGDRPVVRRRNRRRFDVSQLQPPQAATAEAIQDAADAAAERDAGPDALNQLSVLQQAEAAAEAEARGERSMTEQRPLIDAALATVTDPASTTQQVLDRVEAIIGSNHPLTPIVQALRIHPSASNVRWLDAPLADASNALGQYYGDVHAIYINDLKYEFQFDALMVTGQHQRVDLDLADTIVHELVHAASVRYLNENPESEEFAELRRIADDIVGYVNENRARFSAQELETLQNMLVDPAEMITYSMTNVYAQKALSRIPSDPTESGVRGIMGYIIDNVLKILGMQPAQGTALDSLIRVSSNVVDLDAASTEKTRATIDTSQSLAGADLTKVTNDLRTLESNNFDISGYADALADYMDAADDARMEGNKQAEIEALEGLKRVTDAVAQRAAEVGLGPAAEKQRIRPLNQAAPSDPLSDRLYDRAVAKAPTPLRNMLTDMKNRIKRFGYLSMFSHDFVDNVKQYLPQVETYFTTIFNRLSERNNQHVEIQKIVEPVSEFTSAQREAMNTFLRESTYKEAWGFQPDWMNEQVDIDPQLERMYNELPAEAQQVARNMFRYAQVSNQQIQAQLRNDIITTYDAYIDKARSDRERDKRQQQKEQALQEHDARQVNFKAAYLPLKRWGEWAIVHKSGRFKAAEAAKNRGEINRLKADPNHYRAVFAETEYQARQERDRMAEELGTTVEDPFPRMRFEQANETIPFDLMQRLRAEALSDPDSNSATDQRVASAIDKLYIEALAESSVRKSELRRLKVEGAGQDMVRAFVEHGQGLAALSSALKINKETRRVLAEMKQYATDPKAGKERVQRMQALNEVLARHAVSLEIDGRDNWQQKVMGYTSIWMLLTSPAYYIQNSTQPFMLTYPVLAARFGTTKAMGYMHRAYRDVFKAERSTQHGELLDPQRLSDPEEQALFGRLQRLGLLDVGIAADLGSLREEKGPIGKGFYKVHRKMLTAVRTVEVYNRGVTAVASYRLRKNQLEADREAGRNQLSNSAIVEQAKQYAMKTVQTTQGDYSNPNAPRLIDKIPAGRLVTQFRKFQLIQIGLLVRTFHQAFKGATAAEKAIGKRQLTYILAMHGMVGGAMGLPAANIIGYAIAKAFGDEDEPANAELLARRMIGDKDWADLLLKGIPASLGVDASTRLGMGLTFSLMPFADISASRDGFYTVLGNLAGPTAGLGAMFADGVGQIQQGNVAMGMSQLMPSVLKNATRAYLYKTDGVRMRNGDLALSAEELSWFDTATQGLGWPSTKITDRYWASGSLRDVQEHFRGRTTKIKRAYTEAWNAGDRAAMEEARDAWRRLQGMRREYRVGSPQSISLLTKAPMEQRERERRMVRGVATERTTQRFVESLFE